MYVEQDDVWLASVIAVFTALTVAWSWLSSVPFTDPLTWRLLFSGLGAWKHAGFLLLQSLQVIVPFLPGQATSVASGFLFGFRLGFAYSMIGSMIGSVVAYVVAQRWGRSVLLALFGEENVSHWDRRVEEYGVPVFFAMLLLPGFPDDVLCFIAGLSTMRFDWYLVSAFFGRLPLFALYAYGGAHPGELMSPEGLVIAVGLTVVSSLCFWYREKLFSWLTRLLPHDF